MAAVKGVQMTNRARVLKEFPPGSNKALNKGCTCPVLDNSHGKGYLSGIRGGLFWISEVCPIHSSTANPNPRKLG